MGGEGDERESSLVGGKCLAYLRTGECPRPGRCKFLHPVGEDLVRAKEEQEEVVRRRREETEEQRRERMVGKEDKGQRAKVFADWIVATYGRAWLEGGLTLDVGGGRGDLAFELCSRRGLPCAVVDPRPGKLHRWQARYRSKHPAAMAPAHHLTTFDGLDTLDRLGIPAASVRLVVGLHPDEATEPLVTTALSLGLDFCVIPCCVFAASFPHRRLRDGTQPSSYHQFLGFLREQDDRIREDRLQFQGKNTVLFLNQRADNKTG